METPYPTSPSARNRWILQQRGPKNPLDPWQSYAFLREEEFGAKGKLVSTVTVFLTNRECPYRCLMCDLWRNTLDNQVPPGAIAAQIRHALERLPANDSVLANSRERNMAAGGGAQIKLYNAGSFFDPQAIPPEDDAEIAQTVAGFERVIVECHPAFIGERCLRFRDRLNGQLEVAIGLETAHPDVLERLNKRMTLEMFRQSADFLARNRIALRVFLLLRPPFLDEREGVEWAQRSLDVAFDCGATVCVLIPTRAGNGAMEMLAKAGDFAPPSLRSLETAQEYGLRLQRGGVFADLWDIERLSACACSAGRVARLDEMNRTQRLPLPVLCPHCH